MSVLARTARRSGGAPSPRRALAHTLVATGIALAMSAPVLADDDDAGRARTLETVVVTASGFEQAIEEAPASITVLTREELEKRFYSNVYDAVQSAPGVIVTGGSDKQDISLRGMGSQYTLILVDGKRQSSSETRTNSDGPGIEGGWTPPLGAIERIEIVRGPMSTLYGSDAIGGVINIITRKVPETWSGQLRFDTTQQEDSRSGNVYQGNFYVAGPLRQDLLGLQVHGQYVEREEDRIVNGYRGRESTSINAKLSLTPNQDHDIILEVGRSEQDYTQKVGMTIEDTPPPCGRFGCPADSFTKYENTKYSLSHTGRFDFGTWDTWVKRDTYENKSRLMEIENTDFQTSLVA